MGNFFDSIKDRKITVDKQLLNASGSKLREYFCSYRSICEDFIIRIPEYVQIFGCNVKSFEVWDPQRRGIIDALEMFSGLIVFSKVAYEDKIKFLYQIFDLNEEGYLEYDELIFMLMNICEATCKIYQMQGNLISDQIIQQYLDQFFSDQTQLKYQDFLRWSYRTNQIHTFFKLIGHPFEPQTNTHSIDKYDENFVKSKRSPYLSPFNYKKQSKLKIKLQQRFLSLIRSQRILLLQQSNQQKSQQFNPVTKWIYGIRIDDIRYPLHYRTTQQYKAANQKFIYICGKNVIVLYPKLNMQRNYTLHQQPVSCVEIGDCNSIVASGEMGLYPSIHIWDIKTAQPIYKFDRIHKNSIKLLKFIKGNELLITVSEKYNSSVVILNMVTKQKVLSTYLIEPVLNILMIPAQQNNNFLMVLPSHIVKCSSTGQDSYLVSYHQVVKEQKQKKQRPSNSDNSGDQQENEKNGEQKHNKIKKIQVSAIVTVPIAAMNMLIVADATNRLFLLNLNTKQLTLSTFAPTGKIIDILSSHHQKNYFYILYEKSFALLKIQPDLMLKPIVNVNVPTDLFNLEFVQLIEVGIDCVILVSLMGDVIKVSNFMNSTQITNNVGSVRIKKKASKKISLQNQQSQNKLESSVEHEQNEYNYKQKKGSKDKQLFSNEDNCMIDYYKYCQIFKIQKITGICFLQTDSDNPNEEPKLIIASSSLIYMIDQVQKQLLFLQFFSGNISHIHSVNSTYAIATEQNFLFIMRNRVQLENGKCLPANNSKSTINGLKITTDNLIVAIDQEIIMYYEGPNGKYLQGGCNRIKVVHGIPINISTTSIPKVFLVITKDKAILKLNEQTRDDKIFSAKQLNCDFLQTFYPQANTIKTPILFSGNKRIFLLAQPNGDIWLWGSFNQMIKNQQSYSTLTGHCSAISELVFTSKGFISSGKEDGMVVVWEGAEVAQDDGNQDQDQRNMFSQKKNKNNIKNNQDSGLNLQTKSKDQFYSTKSSSNCCMDELLCLEQFVCDKVMLKDSQIQVIAKDGDLYKDISLNINQIIMPTNLQVYEPLIERKKVTIAQNQLKNPKKASKITEKLSLNLKCSFIYGFNSEKSRQSLYYVHHYLQKDQKNQTKILSQQQSSQKKKHRQVEYTKNVLLPLNETHQSCRRGFIYYAGRIGIVWSPMLKTQFHYDFHVNRITCMAVHPHKNIVCTAEMSNSVPSVHVWDSNTMTMMRYFKTRHIRIISKVQFSRNGEYVISLGGPAYKKSIEIHNWNRQERVCYKLIEETCFYDIKSNPYDYNEVAVCGPKNLWIMKVSNRTLIKKQQAFLRPNEQITCMAYTSSIYGNSIESDIITGNSQGDLSLFICGKYIVCKKQAHKKSINCLKLCELFKYKTVVISAAQDNMIKFWDTKFNEITCINTEDVLQFQKSMKDHLKISSVAPQSIDVYHCFTQKDGKGVSNINNSHQENSQSETLLLVGTRNGSIFEVKISNEYQGLKIFVVKNDQTNTFKKKSNQQAKQQQLNPLAILGGLTSIQSQHEQQQVQQSVGQTHKNELAQKLQLNYICHFNNLPATFSRSVIFDTKDNLMITYSRISPYFVLWNIQKREIIKVHKLENYPMVIKFSKTKYIVVGYVDGRINFLELDPISLAITTLQQKIFAGAEFHPLNIVFSQNDAKIAVVFSKQQIKRVSNNTAALCQDEGSSSQGQQILIIYEKIFNGLNQITVNQKNTHIVSSQKRKYKNIFWCDFNTGGSKLLICYTYNDYMKLNNQNRRRMMNSFQGSQSQPLYQYLLYDVVRRMEKDLTSQQFNVLNFSPAIRAKYHYYADCKVVEEYYTSSLAQQRYDNTLWGANKKKGLNGMNSKDNGQNSFMDKDQAELDPIGDNVGNAGSMGTQIIQEFVPICQMTQFEKFTILGNIYGEIFVMKSAQFYSLSAQNGSNTDKKSVKSRCYAIFDSPINNMQVVGNKLLVSAKDCGAVAQYKIIVQQATGMPTLQPNQMIKFQSKVDENKSQKYYENYSVEKIENWLKYVFPKRKNFYEYKLNCEEKKSTKDPNFESQEEQTASDLISLQPFHIIGRNAYYRRNNILMDLKDNLITFSGCNLLIMSSVNNQKSAQYRQQFLKLDNSVFSVNPQISTITLSDDKRLLYAGTIEENCQFIMWDISTRTQMQHVCFRGFVNVVLVKVSSQQRHAVVLALDKQAKQFLFFVSLTKFEILASFCISEEPLICDIEFVPDNQFKFLVCGVNYLAQWSLKGGLLNCEKYSLKNPKDYGDTNNVQNRLPLIFYSIIFIKDVAITAGSDGYLYMWNDRNLINSQNANPKAAILTLFASKNSKIFASGAVDGKANIWHLDSSFIIQKVFEFSLYSGKQTIIPSKFHIQSVVIGKNELFVGTRSGQIHRFEFNSIQNTSQTSQAFKNEEASNKKASSSSLILSAFDNDQINSCSFNISSQKLYVLTQSGIFSVFNLLTSEKIKEQKIKVENEQIVKMLACKLSNKIYIILKKSIEVYAYMQEGKYSSSNKFTKLKQCLKSLNSQIKTGILSLNERYLALLICPNQQQNAKIKIYDMSQPDGNQFFSQYKVLESIPANIQIIDFSTDNGYLVYKKSDDDETIIDLTTKQQIKTKDIEFEIEWNEQAKRTSKYIRDICCTYSDQNKLRTVIQVMNHSVLATDEMGSLRIYRYKQNIQENSIQYYRVYLEHLNDVYQCIISSDCSTLVTVGRHDKSIIIWKIKNFDLEQKKPKKKKKMVQWAKSGFA